MILLIGITGCDSEDNPGSDNLVLVLAEPIRSFTDSEITSLAEVVNQLDLPEIDFVGVDVFKLIYNTTDTEGNKILASGALIIPNNGLPVPLVSYQHGTILSQSEAPSSYSTGLETTFLATLLAGAGYAVSVPDYLGYGISSNVAHPYEHALTLATASFDMLITATEFLEDNQIPITNKLFLTGYSEGGGATMALHQYIEEHSELTVTLSAPASGAYNKTAFAQDILQRDESLDFLPTYLWVIHTYNWVYNLDQPWSYYVNEPYATTLENISDPMLISRSDINDNPNELFTETFILGIQDGSEPLLDALADNDRHDWMPQSPIVLFYGTADDFVFPLNSITAFESLSENGAEVEQVVYKDADHGDAFPLYVADMFRLFESLK